MKLTIKQALRIERRIRAKKPLTKQDDHAMALGSRVALLKLAKKRLQSVARIDRTFIRYAKGGRILKQAFVNIVTPQGEKYQFKISLHNARLLTGDLRDLIERL